MEDSRSKRYAHFMCGHDMTCAHKTDLSQVMQCVNHDNKNLTNKQESYALTCQCSCALCWRCSWSWWSRCHWCRARFHHADAIPLMVTLSLVSCSVPPRRRNNLGGHVVIGVVLGFTTHTPYQVQISFLLDFVVHFCTCSQTVFCDRQFLSVAKLLHTFASRKRVIWGVVFAGWMMKYYDFCVTIGRGSFSWAILGVRVNSQDHGLSQVYMFRQNTQTESR